MNKRHHASTMLLPLALCVGLIFGVGTLACGEEPPHLCKGPTCANALNCPDEQPEEGGSCSASEQGDCHYCIGSSTMATGYVCDGSSWSIHGEHECGRTTGTLF